VEETVNTISSGHGPRSPAGLINGARDFVASETDVRLASIVGESFSYARQRAILKCPYGIGHCRELTRNGMVRTTRVRSPAALVLVLIGVTAMDAKRMDVVRREGYGSSYRTTVATEVT
jgi:hypothetical protein